MAYEHGERLSVIELSRSVVARYADLHLRDTCDAVARHALEEAGRLRERGTSDWRAGRRHAYLAMLLLNANLCRGSLGG